MTTKKKITKYSKSDLEKKNKKKTASAQNITN